MFHSAQNYVISGAIFPANLLANSESSNPNSTEEDQLGLKKCRILHVIDIQWLACHAVSAFCEFDLFYDGSC